MNRVLYLLLTFSLFLTACLPPSGSATPAPPTERAAQPTRQATARPPDPTATQPPDSPTLQPIPTPTACPPMPAHAQGVVTVDGCSIVGSSDRIRNLLGSTTYGVDLNIWDSAENEAVKAWQEAGLSFYRAVNFSDVGVSRSPKEGYKYDEYSGLYLDYSALDAHVAAALNVLGAVPILNVAWMHDYAWATYRNGVFAYVTDPSEASWLDGESWVREKLVANGFPADTPLLLTEHNQRLGDPNYRHYLAAAHLTANIVRVADPRNGSNLAQADFYVFDGGGD